MTDPLSLIPETSFIKKDSGKFSAKLTEADRYSILALVKAGVRRDRVAAAYCVDRRTVTHICNPASPHYRAVRKHYLDTGHEEFIKKYLTEEVALKIANLPAEPAAPLPKDKNAPNPRANRLAGHHRAKPEQCEYEHRIEIAYMKGEPGQAIEADGWYFRDLDSKDNPDTWFHNGVESRRTSQSCYDAAVENLMDD